MAVDSKISAVDSAASVLTRGSLLMDLEDPGAYLAERFPIWARSPEEQAADGESIPESGAADEDNESAEPGMDAGEPDEKLSEAASSTGTANGGEVVREIGERSRRAALALAEVRSAAQQRGLLKSASSPSAGAEVVPANGDADRDVVEPGQSSAIIEDKAVVSAGQNGVAASGGVLDQGQLVALATELETFEEVSGVFLLDERGYSLLPSGSETAGADEFVLHDLALRSRSLLRLADRRCSAGGSQTAGKSKAAAIARIDLGAGNTLVVLRSLPADVLLSWREKTGTPLDAVVCQRAGLLLKRFLRGS